MGLYRRDNNEFPHGLFNPGWNLKFRTIGSRLAGYFNRREVKSRGSVPGVLDRKRIFSIEKVYIGKETNPLASNATDVLLEEDVTIFAACQTIIGARELALDAFTDAELNEIADASGMKPDLLRAAAERGQSSRPSIWKGCAAFFRSMKTGDRTCIVKRCHRRYMKHCRSNGPAPLTRWSGARLAASDGSTLWRRNSDAPPATLINLPCWETAPSIKNSPRSISTGCRRLFVRPAAKTAPRGCAMIAGARRAIASAR